MPTGRVETAWFQESVGPEAESQPCHSQPGDRASHLASPHAPVFSSSVWRHTTRLGEGDSPSSTVPGLWQASHSARKLGVSHWREQEALNTALLQHRGILDEPPVPGFMSQAQDPSRLMRASGFADNTAEQGALQTRGCATPQLPLLHDPLPDNLHAPGERVPRNVS